MEKQKFSFSSSGTSLLVPLLLFAAPVTYSINLGIIEHKALPAGPYVTPADIIVLVLAIVLFLAIVVKKEWSSFRFPPFAGVALFVWFITGLFRMSENVPVEKTALLKEAVQILEYLCIGYSVFLIALRNRNMIERFLDTLSAITTIVLVMGYWQYFSGSVSEFMVRGTFDNNNILSAYLAIVAPCIAGAAFMKPALWRKLWSLIVVVLSIPLIMNGWFLGIFVLCMVLFLTLNGRWFGIIGGAALVGLVLIALPLLPKDNLGRISQTAEIYHKLNKEDRRALQKSFVVSTRVRDWQASILAVREEGFVKGYGPSSYSTAIRSQYFFDPKHTARTDNIEAFDYHVDEPGAFSTYLILLVEEGIVGLMLFLILLFSAFRWSGCCAFSEDRYAVLSRGVLCSLIGVFLGAQFTNVLDRGLAFILVFLLALSFSLYEYAKGYRQE